MTRDEIVYGETHPLILGTYSYLRAAIKSPVNYFKSFKKDISLKKGEVTAITCVWDEQDHIAKSLHSTHKFVDKYMVVDKNGETIPEIKKIQDKLDLDVIYFIKPKLNLLESRKYAIEKTKSDWILIQDGDEVFNNAKNEPNSIFNLREYMIYPNIILKTRMNVLRVDFLHTQRRNNAYHAFMFHNNGDIYFGKADIPRGKGRIINLKHIYKWNLSRVKSTKRIFLRTKYWNQYESSGLTAKYPTLIDYVENYLGINITQEDLEKHEQENRNGAILYNESIQGKLPKVLRKLVENGIIK